MNNWSRCYKNPVLFKNRRDNSRVTFSNVCFHFSFLRVWNLAQQSGDKAFFSARRLGRARCCVEWLQRRRRRRIRSGCAAHWTVYLHLQEHMSQTPGPISDYGVHSLPWWAAAAKISIMCCQVAECREEKLVYLLHTAAPIGTNSKVNWVRIILLLRILYSFYHGKITCNIRLYLQFHFYKTSLQGLFFLICWVKKKKSKQTVENNNSRLEHTQIINIQHSRTSKPKLYNTHINKYRHSLTAPRQIFLQPRTCTIRHFPHEL